MKAEKTLLNILLIEPFFTGSHAEWCKGFQRYSRHSVEIVSLEGRHWKWRMHGGAISIARKLQDKFADLIIVSDMIDLALLKSMLPTQLSGIPIALYMHENQLTYPWSKGDVDIELKRDRHYGFINYSSALIADRILFNSHYHLSSFIDELPRFLTAFPDHRNIDSVVEIKEKSSVLHLGMNLKKYDKYYQKFENEVPVLLWNHRWEYDKNPEEFFNTLILLKDEGFAFQLIVTGESYKYSPEIFEIAKSELRKEIIHFGWVDSIEKYAELLWRADIIPVTSYQDFFGGSVVEAMYCGCYPLLPNRLSYPEHLQEASHLYSDGLFKEILAENLVNSQSFNGQFLIPYDWTLLIEKYDQVCLEMV